MSLRVAAVITLVTAVFATVLPTLLVPKDAIADGSTRSGGQYIPLQGQGRIMDTRAGYGTGGYTSPMPANTWRTVLVDGQAGVPAAGVAAVAVTFTAVNNPSDGYLKADKDETTPNATVSYLFWKGGQQQSNSGVLSVASDGKIQVMATSVTDLYVDVQGYYTSGSPDAGGYVPLTQTRLIDTRYGTGIPKAPFVSGSTTTLEIGGFAGVPADASAVMLNFLITDQSAAGRINPWPADVSNRPQTAMNFGNDGAYTMSAPVRLSAPTSSPAGAINVYTTTTTDLVVDVLGYFTRDGGGGAFTPAKARVMDSRNNGGSPLVGGATRTIQVTGVVGVPASGVAAATLNLTIFDDAGTTDSWVHAWPDGAAEPNPSFAVMYHAADDLSNLVTLALGKDGAIQLHNMGSDSVNFAVDVEGWYADAPRPIVDSTLCISGSVNGCTTYDATQSTQVALSASTTDPLNSSLRYDFELWSTDESDNPTAVLAIGSIANMASDENAAWTPSAGIIPFDIDVAYRVRAYDGTSYGSWSNWYTFFIVNPTDPNPTDAGGVIDEDSSIATAPDSTKEAQVAQMQSLDERAAIDAGATRAQPQAITYHNLRIAVQMQQHPEWCVPAATRAILTHFGQVLSQTAIARAEGTGAHGTALSRVPAVLNAHQGYNGYVIVHPTSASNLFSRVHDDIQSWNSPMLAGVRGKYLPIWAANNYNGYHAETLYGYASDGTTLQYFDPLDATPMYGRHVVNKSDMYAAMTANGNDLVW